MDTLHRILMLLLFCNGHFLISGEAVRLLLYSFFIYVLFSIHIYFSSSESQDVSQIETEITEINVISDVVSKLSIANYTATMRDCCYL